MICVLDLQSTFFGFARISFGPHRKQLLPGTLTKVPGGKEYLAAAHVFFKKRFSEELCRCKVIAQRTISFFVRSSPIAGFFPRLDVEITTSQLAAKA